METPLSTRRVTRSQTLASASGSNSNIPSSRKVEDSEKNMSKSIQKSAKKQQQDRSVLIDITNDSPIVGLAIGNFKTPSSALSKKRMNQAQFTRTPGSGEALLRGQVKTLLQKVEEEAELSKITLENRPFFNVQGLINNSPINLVAPTPANTPQIFNLSANGDALPSLTPSPVTETCLLPQMLNEMFGEQKQESIESETITRSLFLDFSEKSDSSDCSSVVTYQGVLSGERESSRVREKVSTDDDDDDSSIWSIQVNASSTRDDEEEEQVEVCTEEEEEEEEYYEDGHDFGDNGWLEDVCEGMSKLSVKEGPKFAGKHTRFVYNGDGEIVEEEEEADECETPRDNVKNQ